MKKALLAPVLAIALFVAGCSAQQTAMSFYNVINGVLHIAQAEESALPANDAAIITPWVSLGLTLEGQLGACITNTSSLTKKGVFAQCFNAFASGLLSSTELAQLRVLSSGSQAKVQLWVTVAVVAVNGALAAFSGNAVVTPTVGAAPTSAELNQFGQELEQGGYMPPGGMVWALQ